MTDCRRCIVTPNLTNANSQKRPNRPCALLCEMNHVGRSVVCLPKRHERQRQLAPKLRCP
jgi:hypothetical protein